MLKTIRVVLAALLLWSAAGLSTAVADDEGSFGFAARVEADGFLSPTLKSVVIQSVAPGLPAAQAGIVAGDAVIEVEGAAVVGAKAFEIGARMTKAVGQTLTLKLRRSNGEVYVAVMTAAPKK